MAPSVQERQFLDPMVVARLGTLELKARTIVEGFLSGLHRSPFKGFSVEFAEYRQYIPGDDLSTMDWKVYARSDPRRPVARPVAAGRGLVLDADEREAAVVGN